MQSLALFAAALVLSPAPKPDTLTASCAGYKFTLTSRSVKTLSSNEGYWGCFGEGTEQTVVTRLQITRNGKKCFVPRSCFCDLSNVNAMRARQTKRGVIVHIEGADAGESYTADIMIRNGDVTDRIVRNGEFPESGWEKTHYDQTPTDSE